MKNGTPHLLQNSALQLAALLAKKCGVALIFILMARHAGEILLGKYIFIYSAIAIVSLIAGFGLSPLAIRETARHLDQAGKYFYNLVFLRLILSIVAILSVILFAKYSSVSSDTRTALIVLGIGILPGSIIDQAQATFAGFQRMEFISITTILQWGITVVACVYILYHSGSLVGIVSAQVMTTFIVAAACFYLLKSFLPPGSAVIEISVWAHFIREAAPLVVSTLFGILYFRIGALMLSTLQGDAAVGWFGSAFHINEALQVVPMSICAALLPHLSASTEISVVRNVINVVLKYNLIVSLPLAIGVYLLAPEVSVLVFGPRFIEAAVPLRITILALVPIFMNFVMGTVLITGGFQKVIARNAILCCFVSVILNYLLIRRYSYKGAAIATLTTELTLLALNALSAKRYLDFSSFRHAAKQSITATVVMGVVVYGMKVMFGFGLIFVTLSAVIVYFATLYLQGTITRLDWSELAVQS